MGDSTNLMRIAKLVTVEYRQCSRDGIVGDWTALTNAQPVSITQGNGRDFNQAVIDIADTRWDIPLDVKLGYQVRLRYGNTVLFEGFIVKFHSGFSTAVASDPQNPPSAKEFVRINCLSYLWLYNACSPVYGQVARGKDDYNIFWTKRGSATYFSGRRCSFNPDGKYNMDPDIVTFESGWNSFTQSFSIYVFFNATKTGTPWTAGKAIGLLMSPIYNRIPEIVSIPNPFSFAGLDHTDFDTTLNNIVVDGLNVIEAVDLICQNIGWTFREQYSMTGPSWVFFKKGMAAGSSRVYTKSGYNPCILHSLHAPAVGENVASATGAVKKDGLKIICSLDLTEDITPVINDPWGLGAPHQFEITAKLVPAWLEDDLHITETADGLYYTESELQDEDDPNTINFFKYHHALGDSFLRDVGRKWALNESGKYTYGLGGLDYDRGNPFDFTTVGIPSEYIIFSEKNYWGFFDRRLLPCLTFDKDSLNSVGIRAQWSYDGGLTWQELDCPMEILDGEAGIRLMIPNLAEIVDIKHGTIASGTYENEEINFYTSLADDKKNSRVFKDGEWNTRVRVTATVQMDRRIRYGPGTVYDGSPYKQSRIFDFSDRYTLQERCSSSSYYGGSLPTWDTDETAKLTAQMELIRLANEDMAIHGQAMLDRLWIDGTNTPDIEMGDGVSGITGRTYALGQTLGTRTVYPEVVQIQYLIQSQKQVLLLRDARLSIQTNDMTIAEKRAERRQSD